MTQRDAAIPHAAETYPQGTQAALLRTGRLTAPTRAALEARAAVSRVVRPRAFDAAAFATLHAVCDRLLAQDHEPTDARVDIAGTIDTRLAEGRTDGWRYDALPSDVEALRSALEGLDEAAQAIAARPFAVLDADRMDAVLAAVRDGKAPGSTWAVLDGARIFEDLLAGAAEIFYASARAQDEIGYVGYADARGWHAIGLDRDDGIEPRPASA